MKLDIQKLGDVYVAPLSSNPVRIESIRNSRKSSISTFLVVMVSQSYCFADNFSSFFQPWNPFLLQMNQFVFAVIAVRGEIH
jgi:hypothetical protein